MHLYQAGGRWYVVSDGGTVNGVAMPSDQSGPFATRPEPLSSWRSTVRRDEGMEYHTYMLYAVGGTAAFTVHRFDWAANGPDGGTWQGGWEALTEPEEPPLQGEVYRWTGAAWERLPAQAPDAPAAPAGRARSARP